MQKLTLVALALFLFLNNKATAQGIVQLGTPFANDLCHDLLLTSDGHFVTAGTAGSNAVLYKTDCAGQVVAQIQKGYSPGPTVFWDAVELGDGSIVAIGSATIATPSDTVERVFLLKTTASLTEIASSNFLILNKPASAKSIAVTASGHLLLLGEVAGFSINFTDMFFQRVSPATLQPTADPVIFNNGVDLAGQILRVADGNFILAGSSFLGNIFNPDAPIDNRFLAIKTDENGALLWQQEFRDTFLAQYGLGRINAVAQNPATGNIMLAGTSFGGTAALGQDPFFVLMSNNGNLLDTAIVHLPERQNLFNMIAQQGLAGLFLAVGESANPSIGTPNFMFAQAFESGDQISQTFAANDTLNPVSIIDVVEISPNRFAFNATVPDNPFALGSKDIVVATPAVDNIEILYQNCALVASFSASDPSYQWYLDGVPIPGATSGFYFPTQTGTYQVQITDGMGCIGASDTLTVTLPAAGFDVSADNGTYSFTNTSVGASAYLWNFGDGQTSTQANPVHTYTNSGPYIVTLVAFSACAADTVTNALVGADEPSWLQHFRLFPNPSEGAFNVEINGEAQGELAFSLFNSTGQLVDRQIFDFRTGVLQQRLDFGDLPPGIYTLQIQAQGEAKYVKVVVR